MATKTELMALAVELLEIDAIKLGCFVDELEQISPIRIDLTLLMSNPKLLADTSRILCKQLRGVRCTHVCATRSSALPLATVISRLTDLPLLVWQKDDPLETESRIVGDYKEKDRVVVIVDSLGTSDELLEAARDFVKEDTRVRLILGVVDLELGGKECLQAVGLPVDTLFTTSGLIERLTGADHLMQVDLDVVKDYLRTTRKEPLPSEPSLYGEDRLTTRFETRASHATNPVAAKLFQLMARKRTMLCMSADYVSGAEVLRKADLAGPHIAVLKIHVDMLVDFGKPFILLLRTLAAKHDFLVMEDSKFANSGPIVVERYKAGAYLIAEWADLVTVHALPGPGIFEAFRLALQDFEEPRGVFVVAELLTRGSLTRDCYIKAAKSLGAANDDLVAGFVCQRNIHKELGFVQLAPGVCIDKMTDSINYKYKLPGELVAAGADLVVVDCHILDDEDITKAMVWYKTVLFEAYEKRVGLRSGRPSGCG